MDPISLTGAYQGLKAAKDILGTLFDAKVESESRPKILEVQAKLGEVQDALFMLREKLAELQQERDQLRDELASAKNWSDRAAQYELATTPGSAVVFRFTEQPEHFACPSCFNKAEVQILQDNRVMAGTYRCPGCEAQFPVKLHEPLELPRVRRGVY